TLGDLELERRRRRGLALEILRRDRTAHVSSLPRRRETTLRGERSVGAGPRRTCKDRPMTTLRKPHLFAAAVTMVLAGFWAAPAFADTLGPWTPELGLSKKPIAVVAVIVVVIVAVIAFFVVRRNRQRSSV